MAALKWALCFQRAIIDKQGNKLTLVDHLERITLPHPPRPEEGSPLLPLKFSAVTYWQRSNKNEPETAEMRARLLAPDGTQLGEGIVPIDLTSSASSRNIIGFPGLPLSGEGEYVVEISLKVGNEWARQEASPSIEVMYASKEPPRVRTEKPQVKKPKSRKLSKKAKT